MERILRERDRLLQYAARLIGLTSAAVALACLAAPGAVPLPLLLLVLPGFGAMVGGLLRIRVRAGASWAVLVVAGGLQVVLALHLAGSGILGTDLDGGADASAPVLSDAAQYAATLVSGGAMAAVAVVLTVSLGRMIGLVASFAAAVGTAVITLAGTPLAGLAIAGVVLGWLIAASIGAVLHSAILRAARRISVIGRAHRQERQASETEAQRRQGARLLHDTVLATLTLLAHSGVGVQGEAMRLQAADDARLLRQLRLGTTPVPQATPPSFHDAGPGTVQAPPLGTTLDAVKQRFGRMGLEVHWHGGGEVPLEPAPLEAFLLSLSECLENVRRHAGVAEAHVTITEDEKTVRAMVTDSGVGFDVARIPDGKLGYKESIVARLTDVGGSARLFSAPGSGTTVVLEVPR